MFRKLMVVFCLVGFLFFLTVSAHGKESDVIKIGHLDPYTGPYASFGEDSDRGMRLYFEQVDWKVAGKKLQLLNEDSEASPKVALDKLKKMREYDKIDILAGITSSGVGHSIWKYVISNRIPWIQSTACGDPAFSFTKRSKYIFRAQYSIPAEESIVAYGAYEAGHRKAIVGAADYVGGHTTANVFKVAFKEKGGKIAQEFFPPFGTTDYSPYLTSLKIKDADCVWVFFSGSDAVGFISQFHQYGLNKRIQLLASSHAIAPEYLPQFKEAGLGVIGSSHWFPDLDTAENKKFVESYKSKFNDVPSLRSLTGFNGARVIVEALKMTNGDMADLDNFLSAVGSVSFQAPQGLISFEPETNTVIQDYYLVKIVRQNSGFGYEVLKKYPQRKTAHWGPKLYGK